MSAPSTETAGVTKPIKDTAESLNAMLWAKADAELKAIIDRHINLKGLETDTFGFHGGGWKHVIDAKIDGVGYLKEVWAPSLIETAKEAAFFALRDSFRNRYVSAFIHKITSMQEELESLQAQVG